MGHKKPQRIDPLTLPLPPGGVDSHAHLDGEEFNPDREAVLERARAVGLTGIGNVFLSPQAFSAHREYFTGHPEVFFLLGIHPCDGAVCTPACLDSIAAVYLWPFP